MIFFPNHYLWFFFPTIIYDFSVPTIIYDTNSNTPFPPNLNITNWYKTIISVYMYINLYIWALMLELETSSVNY